MKRASQYTIIFVLFVLIVLGLFWKPFSNTQFVMAGELKGIGEFSNETINADKIYLPLTGNTFTKEPIGFAIRKGDVDFLNYLNNWILVKESDGWLLERYRYWFTTNDWKGLVE